MAGRTHSTPGRDARHEAVRVVRAHLETGSFPDRMLERVAVDRAAVSEIVYGVMRRRRALQWILDQAVEKRPGDALEAALLVGLYQLLFMSNVDKHAAVNETVAAAKSITNQKGANLVNAVLRRAQREKSQMLQGLADQSPGIQLSHPDLLIERWTRRFGPGATRDLCEWNNLRAHVVLRVRTEKVPLAEYREALVRAGVESELHSYAPDRFLTLHHGARVPELPGYAEGWFVVQDPATSVAVQFLDPQPGERVLDACAAPGGKTMIIADCMHGDGELIAMDLHEDRLSLLSENLARLGHTAVRVIQGDASAMADVPGLDRDDVFDRILLDVPCTNTGVIRRRPDARWRFSAERLRRLTRTQRTLLDSAAGRLKPGGRIVYSTCSLEPEENDDMISAWLAQHPSFHCVMSRLLFPPESQTDGAYVAALERTDA